MAAMSDNGRQQLIVWWVLWAAFQIGILIIYQVLGSSPSTASSPGSDSQLWLAALAPVVLSTIVRWGALPRSTSAVAALPMFIVGIAMAESACFLGLFIFPQHKEELFVASALGIFQFIPFFARRFFVAEEQDSLRGPTT